MGRAPFSSASKIRVLGPEDREEIAAGIGTGIAAGGKSRAGRGAAALAAAGAGLGPAGAPGTLWLWQQGAGAVPLPCPPGGRRFPGAASGSRLEAGRTRSPPAPAPGPHRHRRSLSAAAPSAGRLLADTAPPRSPPGPEEVNKTSPEGYLVSWPKFWRVVGGISCSVSRLAGSTGQKEARSSWKASSTSCLGSAGEELCLHRGSSARGCSDQARGNASAQTETTKSPEGPQGAAVGSLYNLSWDLEAEQGWLWIDLHLWPQPVQTHLVPGCPGDTMLVPLPFSSLRPLLCSLSPVSSHRDPLLPSLLAAAKEGGHNHTRFSAT
ncbi:uncharacterized protein GJ701_004686 isoform 2-T3 [Geothlypis trichas]